MRELIYSIVLIVSFVSCQSGEQITLGNASVQFSNKQIVVSTGSVERVFDVTKFGMATTSYTNLESGINFIESDNALAADWNFSAIIGKADLVSIAVDISDDQGFTDKHIEVMTQFHYPDDNLDLKYVIWVYPDAPGIRTQLFMKTIKGGITQKKNQINTVEQIAVGKKYRDMKFWGYADRTQDRNNDSTRIMKFQDLERSKVVNDWASGMCLSDSEQGLVMIKESNKCFNTGVIANNGKFLADENKISNTGSGYTLDNLDDKEYNSAWATWTILYSGNDDDMQLMLKQFDRIRYTVDKKRDMYMIANTWGGSATNFEAKLAAREENVLREIESQADLGIDIQQIDDGWQGCDTYSDSWRPVDSLNLNNENECDSTIRLPMYPSGGWEKVKTRASKKSIRLGLWVNGGKISYDDLVWNYKNGEFMAIKYDFFYMKSKAEAESHIKKVRDFIRFTNHSVRVNWDVTSDSRIGYYFGKDLGAIYLANRKPVGRTSTIYQPHLVLRDAWHLASYVNLNKFQVTVSNNDLIDEQLSDASKYSHSYSFAISMMAVPVFFQETQFYSMEAREELKPLIALYKQHRENIFDSYIFPVGDQPDNASWTGFQAYNPQSKIGYMTIFRELNSTEKKYAIKLHFLKNRTIKLTNLLTNEISEMEVNSDGELIFQIDNPADFRFFRYECI